ncbi:hypothetical protein PPO43_14210 [Saprospira sp. CCB-QB6]|uniref:hypothetical protein n=1 Tax=Saprospira sp. CCB-QB6 TaxID=3023936 RepID=UPI00234A564F|nr:hypothetical protein [Saprospira sp. CCB-QB6]WCL81125.1 hypothetical protein PPO43_14210 [Saprospira sp. CCB-QB6]
MKKILLPAVFLLFFACQTTPVQKAAEEELKTSPPTTEKTAVQQEQAAEAPKAKALQLNNYKSGEDEPKMLAQQAWPSKEGETRLWQNETEKVQISYQTEFQPGGMAELLQFQLQDEQGQPLGPPLLLYIGEYSNKDAPTSIIRSQAKLKLDEEGLQYQFQSYEENLDTEEKTILQDRNSHYLFGGKEGFQEKK